jgi:hypothetical protein
VKIDPTTNTRQESEAVIAFDCPIVDKKAKSVAEYKIYPDTLNFRVWGYYTEIETTTLSNSQTMYMNGAEFGKDGDTWGSVGKDYYWPKNGSLTFFSFSPFSIKDNVECNTTNGVVISNWDVDANQTVDVMIADVQKGRTTNESHGGYNGVPTIFRHKLSQIVKMTFQTDKVYNAVDGVAGTPFIAGDKQFFVNYVKVNNLEQTGTYTSGINVDGSNLGSWALPTGTDLKYDHDYDWYTGGGEFSTQTDFNTTLSNGYLLMMPQTYVAAAGSAVTDIQAVSHVEIQYTIRTYSSPSASSDDVVTAYVALEDIIGTLEMNKKVTINFTIGTNQIYWAPSVVAWDADDVTYGTTL